MSNIIKGTYLRKEHNLLFYPTSVTSIPENALLLSISDYSERYISDRKIFVKVIKDKHSIMVIQFELQ